MRVLKPFAAIGLMAAAVSYFAGQNWFGGDKNSPGESNPGEAIVGVWAPVEGNPKETMEFRQDGTVRMALFGGAFSRDGRYRFVEKNVVAIDWADKPSSEADAVLGSLNERLAEQGNEFQVRYHQQTVLQVDVTPTELKTLHVEKQRRGHFRRVS
jgi:hypothetical protein